MRAKEFITERTHAKMTKRQNQSTRGVNKFADAERWDSDYVAYRLGMAVAGTDGQIDPNIDASSWVGKWKTSHPYTREEQDMLNKAYNAVGARHQDLNRGDLRSEELDTTNKTSPVAKKKRNKYGV